MNKNKALIIFACILTLAGIWGLFGQDFKLPKISFPKKQVQIQKPPVVTEKPKYTNFQLEIPNLEISAPVMADVDGSDKPAYLAALQSGVAQYLGTKKPGQGGNIFIFGHSSYYIWDKGKYKDIFKNLVKIQTGDEIDLWFQGKKYRYKVVSTKEISPKEVNILAPTAKEQVTLMTCTPVGTDLRRFVAIATPIN